jgi:hypothetical protein
VPNWCRPGAAVLIAEHDDCRGRGQVVGNHRRHARIGPAVPDDCHGPVLDHELEPVPVVLEVGRRRRLPYSPDCSVKPGRKPCEADRRATWPTTQFRIPRMPIAKWRPVFDVVDPSSNRVVVGMG